MFLFIKDVFLVLVPKVFFDESSRDSSLESIDWPIVLQYWPASCLLPARSIADVFSFKRTKTHGGANTLRHTLGMNVHVEPANVAFHPRLERMWIRIIEQFLDTLVDRMTGLNHFATWGTASALPLQCSHLHPINRLCLWLHYLWFFDTGVSLFSLADPTHLCCNSCSLT